MACQVQRDRGELLRRSSLLKQDVEVARHFHHFSKIVLQLCRNRRELFLTMGHFYDADAEALVVEEILLRPLHHSRRQARRPRVEIMLDPSGTLVLG